MILPFKVYSQARSGVHLAVATMWKNFDFGDLMLSFKMPNHTFHSESETWKSLAPVPWGKLLGGNYGYHAELLPAVYVVRHPITRMYSLWKFRGQGKTFEEFATAYRFRDWKNHVDSWRGNAVIVRYEDLNNLFRVNAVLERLEDHFGLISKTPWTYVKRRVGWSPTYNVLGYCPPSVLDTAKGVLGDYYFGYPIPKWRVA